MFVGELRLDKKPCTIPPGTLNLSTFLDMLKGAGK
jgi:hypothetical protein